jgi:hypothetical protein
MTSIVITHYRYKRPLQRRKAVALEVPVVVVAKVGSRSKPLAAPEPDRERTEAPPPAAKPTVVVSVSRKRARLLRSVAEGPIGQPSPEVAAFFAKNVRPGGPRSPRKP